LISVHDYNYDLDTTLKLDNVISDTMAVLRRK
jgi:hypothetical protein